MQQDLFGNIQTGAFFSDDRNYRYALWRIWDKSKRPVMFVGLNPSTANETSNDQTIRKVMKFAKSWGYGGVYMTNLFAIISKDPKVLKTCIDPVGDNNNHLKIISAICKDVVFAWGSFPEAKERAYQVQTMFETATCLGINNDGSPKHPLYIKDSTRQINFK